MRAAMAYENLKDALIRKLSLTLRSRPYGLAGDDGLWSTSLEMKDALGTTASLRDVCEDFSPTFSKGRRRVVEFVQPMLDKRRESR